MCAEEPAGRTGPKLLEQVARAVRARRYSPRTEEAYVGHWWAWEARSCEGRSPCASRLY